MNYYTLRIIYEFSVIFYGYMIVQPDNLITALYDFSLPVDGGYQNVLLPTNDYIFSEADNLYVNDTSFTNLGTNMYSLHMQSILNQPRSHFNLYDSRVGAYEEHFEVSFQISPFDPTPPPPIKEIFNMASLFSNNAQVYYKPHSFSSGGSVTNSRVKKRRT